jgi:hypothetical protein
MYCAKGRSAGLLVMTAQPGGTLREAFSMARAYAEARGRHGQSELLDEIVTAVPDFDRSRYSSLDELQEHCLAHLRDAAGLLDAKAPPAERDEYKAFVLTVADSVARAHGEGRPGDDAISDRERSAIDAVAHALDSASS